MLGRGTATPARGGRSSLGQRCGQAGDRKSQATALHVAGLALKNKSSIEEALKISRSLGDEATQVRHLDRFKINSY